MKKIHIIFILIIILFILFKYKKKETFETTDIKIAILIISDKNIYRIIVTLHYNLYYYLIN